MTVPASTFRCILGADPRVFEYQVRQTVDGAEILAVGDPDVDALTLAVVAALRRQGLSDPKVRIAVVGDLQRHHASGAVR
ncbi:hypothetical protein [Rhodococcus jostii]|uniref:hypothetical protein n=1 Tax=Rhodococcus jostii TaxID=132919 RepID=UPI003639FA95